MPIREVAFGFMGGDDHSVMIFQHYAGKIISNLKITEKELLFTFVDKTKMKLFDDRQICCEIRYMHTDDNLNYYIGARLLGVEERILPKKELARSVQETVFLVIHTSKGQFTVVNYNEHNGSYGGFSIKAEEVL